MSSIHDIQELGYTIGIAHGSVEVEETALNNALVDASAGAVTRQAGQITKATLEDLANAGKLPVTTDQRQALAAQIAEAALEMVQSHADEKVEFHQRALAIAKESPDVWRVEQTVTTDTGEVMVATLLVATKADGTGWDEGAQAVLDALAHQPSYDERVFQAQNPDAMQAAQQLVAEGSTVERDLGSDTFTVDGKTLDAAAIIQLADDPSPGG